MPENTRTAIHGRSLSAVDNQLHQEITSEYATAAVRNGVRMSLRAALRGASFKEQRMVAIALLYRLGVIKGIIP
jgi:hypothetical protein